MSQKIGNIEASNINLIIIREIKISFIKYKSFLADLYLIKEIFLFPLIDARFG